jgi:hypothetical protein
MVSSACTTRWQGHRAESKRSGWVATIAWGASFWKQGPISTLYRLFPTLRFSISTIPTPAEGRIDAVIIAVIRHPTAEWLAQQIIEALLWRDCVDHVIALSEQHLHQIPQSYPLLSRNRTRYYSECRTHRSVGSDASCRMPSSAGCITYTSASEFRHTQCVKRARFA